MQRNKRRDWSLPAALGSPGAADNVRALRVLAVSDVRLYRDGLSQALGRYAQIELVGTCSADPESLACVRELRPDIVLLEVADCARLQLVRVIRSASPTARVVAFAVAEAEADIMACAEAGVCAYVPRDGSMEDMVAVLESAARGELLCTPQVAATLFRRVASLASRGPDGRPGERVSLTARERQIVDLLDRGLSNKEIAQALYIEVATVKNHVHNILEKLRVTSRGEAAAVVRGAAHPRGPMA